MFFERHLELASPLTVRRVMLKPSLTSLGTTHGTRCGGPKNAKPFASNPTFLDRMRIISSSLIGWLLRGPSEQHVDPADCHAVQSHPSPA